jgi:hypothetical protein
MSTPGGNPFGGMFNPFIPRGNPTRGMFGPKSSHTPWSASIPRGTHPFGTPSPSKNTHIGGGIKAHPWVIRMLVIHPPSFSNTLFPFLVTLDFPYLSCLTNDPILHDPLWLAIPAKLPSDMPKFDGNPKEDHLCIS